MPDSMNIGGALRRSIGFDYPVIPWRVGASRTGTLQHCSLLLHRMLDFIMSVLDGQPTYRHGHVHNWFKTVFCPIFSVHPCIHKLRNGQHIVVVRTRLHMNENIDDVFAALE